MQVESDKNLKKVCTSVASAYHCGSYVAVDWRKNIRDAVDDRGWTFTEFIARTGVDAGTVWNWFRDKEPSTPSVENAEKLATALDVSMDYLFRGIGTQASVRLAEIERKIADQEKRLTQTEADHSLRLEESAAKVEAIAADVRDLRQRLLKGVRP